jgi:hypothetical protein
MVCFCDLPLSLIKKHLKEYGSFGIGLSKAWGMRNGLAPVIYTHAKAETRRQLTRLTQRAGESGDDAFGRDLRLLSAYTKLHTGPAWRKGRVQPQVTFYDEREWRYVPRPRGRARFKQPMFLFQSKSLRRSAQTKLEAKLRPLMFEPRDIQYLILPNDRAERGVLELHDFVLETFSSQFGRTQAVLATTAIMTENCIAEDI